jgi:hypothetical protein
MFDIFRQPYGEEVSGRSKLISIFIFGLFIFLFLYLFKPFGMYQLKPFSQLTVSLGFGLITSFVLIVFKFLFEPLVVKNRWTLGKNIFWDFIIASSIGAANYFYICIIFKMDFTPKYLLYSIWTAILVGSIPVTISYFVAYNRRYRSALKEAAVPGNTVLWENEVSIKAGNQKNDLKLNPKNIIYFCSNDNYVTIVAIKGDSQSKITIRGTLKAVESELKRNNMFLRCHKCYIVNASFVERVTGNTQNMKIKMKPSGFEIPVSRAKVSQVVKKLKVT